jgi:sulfide:quinone oxidoreductase
MTGRVVIPGGGTGGTLVANRLRRAYEARDLEIVVLDQDDHHVYQPGLLFVPFGLTSSEEITRPRHRQLRSGVDFRQVAVDHVDVSANRVHLHGGVELDYDVLVVASGSMLVPDETEGLTGPG